jgi:hypothetical protein
LSFSGSSGDRTNGLNAETELRDQTEVKFHVDNWNGYQHKKADSAGKTCVIAKYSDILGLMSLLWD